MKNIEKLKKTAKKIFSQEEYQRFKEELKNKDII